MKKIQIVKFTNLRKLVILKPLKKRNKCAQVNQSYRSHIDFVDKGFSNLFTFWVEIIITPLYMWPNTRYHSSLFWFELNFGVAELIFHHILKSSHVILANINSSSSNSDLLKSFRVNELFNILLAVVRNSSFTHVELHLTEFLAF